MSQDDPYELGFNEWREESEDAAPDASDINRVDFFGNLSERAGTLACDTHAAVDTALLEVLSGHDQRETPHQTFVAHKPRLGEFLENTPSE